MFARLSPGIATQESVKKKNYKQKVRFLLCLSQEITYKGQTSLFGSDFIDTLKETMPFWATALFLTMLYEVFYNFEPKMAGLKKIKILSLCKLVCRSVLSFYLKVDWELLSLNVNKTLMAFLCFWRHFNW